MLVTNGVQIEIPDFIKKESIKEEFLFNIHINTVYHELIFGNTYEELADGLFYEKIKNMSVNQIVEMERFLNTMGLRKYQIFMANLLLFSDLVTTDIDD